jgi:PucR C-terminal helix-turn-helix domain/GGDEF-like domain
MASDPGAVADLVASVANTLARRATEVSEDAYKLILQQIPVLDDEHPLVALLAASVDSTMGGCLQIMQHRIDLTAVRAPAVAAEHARRLAQRGLPLTALLRAYRLAHSCLAGRLLAELAEPAAPAATVTGAARAISAIVAGYFDQTSEEIAAAYTRERKDWRRNCGAARTARIGDLLSGRRIEVSSAEATLGYRLRQHHVGVVCWAGGAPGRATVPGTAPGDQAGRLEHAIGQLARRMACAGEPVFLPRDAVTAWAWLPLEVRDTFDAAAARPAGIDDDIHFAFGEAAAGTAGFRLTHQQAVAAHAVAVAAQAAGLGFSRGQALTYRQVAPVAMMLQSPGLLRAWVRANLAGLTADSDHHDRLRETLLVFLQSGGSYKTTAERLSLHKNTVQYRIRKAEESLGRPVGQDRHDLELALRVSHWLGPAVLQPG